MTAELQEGLKISLLSTYSFFIWPSIIILSLEERSFFADHSFLMCTDGWFPASSTNFCVLVISMMTFSLSKCCGQGFAEDVARTQFSHCFLRLTVFLAEGISADVLTNVWDILPPALCRIGYICFLLVCILGLGSFLRSAEHKAAGNCRVSWGVHGHCQERCCALSLRWACYELRGQRGVLIHLANTVAVSLWGKWTWASLPHQAPALISLLHWKQ